MDNSMQVVWHKAELEDANRRIVPAHHIQLINNCIAQGRPLYPSLRGVILWNHQ
ncbi:MAG: hypothetical protein J5678_05670 [Bacteroidaceae bacterium]|nr:hypothetical protein [Bacteroidaceae bacterium]